MLSLKASKLRLVCRRYLSSDMSKFRQALSTAKRIVFITGGDVSSESGIFQFRNAHSTWRNYPVTSLMSPQFFKADPSLVWEFFSQRREEAFDAKPNIVHKSIFDYEERNPDKHITVITQNIDGLHQKAGTSNVVELHGSIFKTRCTKCNEVLKNLRRPLSKALDRKGAEKGKIVGVVPLEDLPHCKKCGSLLRPHVVFFQELVETVDFDDAHVALDSCDTCLVIGTSYTVPLGTFGPMTASGGALVAEFNFHDHPTTEHIKYHFEGSFMKTVPTALRK